MKYRILLLSCILATSLFIFSKDPPEQGEVSSGAKQTGDVAAVLDSIHRKMADSRKRGAFQELYALEPLFDLNLDNAADSTRLRFRKTCMTYAFQFRRQLSDYRTSLKYYLLAHDHVADPVCLDTLSWFIENEISIIYTRFGDFEKSEYFANQLETSLKCHRRYQYLSRLYTNMGINQKSRGRDLEAADYFLRGLHLADSLQYDVGIFSNCLNLADLYAGMHQDSLATLYLHRAESGLVPLQSNNQYYEKKSGWESTAGMIYGHQKQFSLSIAYYRAAIQTLKQYYQTQKHREFTKLYADLAEIYMLSGMPDSAQWCIDQGILSLVPDYTGKIGSLDTTHIYRENSFLDVFKAQYALLHQQYNQAPDTAYLNQALQCAWLGLYANDLLHEKLSADLSKLSSIRSNKQITNEGVETLYALYSLNPDSKYLDQARELFTRSKSILYNEKIKNQAMVKEMTKEDLALRDSVETKMLDLYESKYEPDADFKSINHQLLNLQETLNGIKARYENIQHPILTHEHYIEYVQTDTAIYTFSEIRGKQKFLQIGATEDFKNLLHRLNQYITLKELSLDTSIRSDLFAFLLKPLDQDMPDKLVIIPDGQVGLIPFEILENKQKEAVVMTSTISYEYQFEPYVLRDKSGERLKAVFCLIPRYSLPAPVGVQASRGSFYDLPYARAEVDTIQKIVGAEVRVSEERDKELVLKELKQARIFHFSGHAIVQSDLAFLALTDEPGMNHQLTDQEIGLLSLPLEMVVLSACETGLGKWEQGEGIRSLGRSFMEAGTGAAVYSLWSVNDRSTAGIMSSFYRFLRKGYPIDEALRKAKLDYLADSNTANKHPYHWAAFIATGDMDPLEKNNRWWMLIIGLGMVFIFILYLGTLRKRQNHT